MDILVQKFLNNDLDSDEQAYVETIKHTEDWKNCLSDFKRLEYDLEKTLYLDKQRTHLKRIHKTGRRNKWFLYAGSGIAAALIIGLIVFDFNDTPDHVAQDSMETNSEVKEAAEGDEADDAVEESTDEVYTEEHSENLAFIASDYDLINNRSIYSFGVGNGAFRRLKESISNDVNSILQVVANYGAKDSVYVFTKSVEGVVFEKHLRFVGQTDTYFVFNLVNKNSALNETQKSILLTNAEFEYYGRYVVESTDDLPDQTLPVGLLYEVEDNQGNWSHAIVEFGEDECIELPSGSTSCISFF